MIMVAYSSAAIATSSPVDNHMDHTSMRKAFGRRFSYCDTFVSSSPSTGSAILDPSLVYQATEASKEL
ncbi:putative collagen alpha [Sesbania bispinosa]|nr:putative collagen alpha [Sesbania bispinosa]